jgi:hypothetical protein
MNNATYRLATKTETGQIIQFGPVMSMAIAERKRKAMKSLTSCPVYVVNINAQ